MQGDIMLMAIIGGKKRGRELSVTASYRTAAW